MSTVLGTTIYPSTAAPRFRVVLLHAFPLSSAMWRHVAEQLLALRDDAELIAVDLPGFGRSPRREGWRMQQFAQRLHDEVIESRGPVILCGLSMGGYAALEYYRQFSGNVLGLVLSNTKAAADTEAAKRAREIFAKDALVRGADAAIERLFGGFVTDGTPPETAAEIRQWMSAAEGGAIADALRAMAARADSTELLSRITVPSLVISSSGDTVMPAAEMRAMAESLPTATYVNIDGVAHLSAVERPKEWAEALSRFLALL